MTWVNAVVQGILLGGLYALFACGLSLVFGVMKLVNLAHGDLSVVAAYLGYVLVEHLGGNGLWTLAVAVPALFVVGYVLRRGLLQAALRRGPLAPLVVTFGVSVIIQNLLQEGFGADDRGSQIGSLSTDSIKISSQLSIGVFDLMVFGVAIAVLVGLQLMLSRTQTGRVMRATADDPEAVRLSGVNDKHVYALVTAIALSTVAIAGLFLAMRTTFTPDTGSVRLIFAFEAVVIGGLGSLWGTLAGGIVLGVAQGIGAQINPAYGILAGHLVFLAVLAVRPEGLFSVGGGGMRLPDLGRFMPRRTAPEAVSR